MDLEQTLYGLDPFVTDSLDKKLPSSEIFKESYTTLLNQLSVLLRDPITRNQELFKRNFGKFVDVLESLLLVKDARDIVLELLKVLINGVADNDNNRDVVLQNEKIWSVLGQFISEEFDDDEVNERIFLLLQNSIVEDVEIGQGKGRYLEKAAGELTDKLYWYLQYNTENQIGIELFKDLIVVNNALEADTSKIESILNKLTLIIEKYKFKDFINDDDGTDEVIVNYSKILETLTIDLNLKFNPENESRIQLSLLRLFKMVEEMEFQNKLKFQRQLYATIGNISSNFTAKNELELTFKENETNGYVVSSTCLVLGNSIGSNEDRSKVIESHPNLLTTLISKFQYLTDPILFQGFLQLLKNVIVMSNCDELFKDFNSLRQIIEAVLTNSQYYQNLVSLLTAFLKKLIVFINKEQLAQLVTIDQLFISPSLNKDPVITLLIINKLIIYKNQDMGLLKKLISKALALPPGQTMEIGTLFEMTKTLGLLAKHYPELLLSDYKEQLLVVLSSAEDLQVNNRAVEAVRNNLRYISGLLVGKSNGEINERFLFFLRSTEQGNGQAMI